ncbi:hypothetical protein ACOMHN_006561 [Nucella lapillus]
MFVGIVPVLMYPTWQKKTAPYQYKPYVEFTCVFPLASIASFLFFNFILAAACGFLAYKTRHLPQGFNESKFITICISTVLTIFVGFIPTFMVTHSSLLKMQITNVIVFLNHSLALIFLFLPKIYAVLRVEEPLDSNPRRHQHFGIGIVSSTGADRNISLFKKVQFPKVSGNFQQMSKETLLSVAPHSQRPSRFSTVQSPKCFGSPNLSCKTEKIPKISIMSLKQQSPAGSWYSEQTAKLRNRSVESQDKN